LCILPVEPQADKSALLLQLDVNATAVRDYGANRHTWMEIKVMPTPGAEAGVADAADTGAGAGAGAGGRMTVLIDLQTEGKTPTRIPEFQRLTFSPAGVTDVSVDKLGTGERAKNTITYAFSSSTSCCTHDRLPRQARDKNKRKSSKMYVSNLGVDVDALDVVARGSVHLHAVGDGGATLTIGNVSKTHAVGTPSPQIRPPRGTLERLEGCSPSKRSRCFELAECVAGCLFKQVSLDTSLLSVGRQTAFPTPLAPLAASELSGGVSFILHDNLWDTNYPAWCGRHGAMPPASPSFLLRSCVRSLLNLVA
jgi:hypothetical protein